MTNSVRHAIVLASVAGMAAAASPVRVIRTVETREPADHALAIMHGESIELRVRLLNYAAPVDLTGWSIVLHGQTNGQAAAESYQVAGVAGLPADAAAAAQGWASVLVHVSAWWPADAAAGRWTLVAASPAADVRVMRAGGPLTVRGTAAADAAAPLPQTVTATLRAEWQADLAAATNTLAASLQGSISIAGDLLATSNALAIARRTGDAATSNHVSQALGQFAASGTVYKATQADRATDASMADWSAAAMVASGLALESEDGQTLYALKPHPTDPAAHLDIRADIEGATNTLVQTYLLGTNAWMTISNQTLTIWRTVDGISSSLWSSAESDGSGDEFDMAFIDALWTALGGKADKAWGKCAPDGSSNPDPEFMTYMNAPATMHASGYQWATSGAYSVLAQSGAVAFESGTDGEARWGLDLHTNYVGFVRGGSVIVGARAGAITVTDGGTTNGIAEIVYPYTSGDFPSLWFAPTLDVPFVVLEGVVWVDNEDGSATVTAAATTPKGFWYATTTITYDVIFDIRPPARLTGGVIGATNAAPVVYDSTINVTSGGKTYRIPAEEVP